MADYIKKLKDKETADGILPVTVSSAVTMTTGDGSLDTKITTIENNITNIENNLVNIVAESLSMTIYDISLLSANWFGASAPFRQEIAVTGLLSTDNPIILPRYSEINATAILEKSNWGRVNEAITKANTIIFTCFESKPTMDINIRMQVVR